jgi:protocadherin Fat 1/2/3
MNINRIFHLSLACNWTYLCVIFSVNEDALPGTVVVALDTKDRDVDLVSPVEFYITGGDPRSQFQIRQTGEVYVAKPLDRESLGSYILDITATDGKFIAATKVTIDILDANGKQHCLLFLYVCKSCFLL